MNNKSHTTRNIFKSENTEAKIKKISIGFLSSSGFGSIKWPKTIKKKLTENERRGF